MRGDQRRPPRAKQDPHAAHRVVNLSRRIALRCVHMEEACLRRERALKRMFQEQLRGVRQVWGRRVGSDQMMLRM